MPAGVAALWSGAGSSRTSTSAATRKVKLSGKLAGVDVIVAHRKLTNLVPVSEYLLMSEPVFRYDGERFRQPARGLHLELEDLGKDRAYFVSIEDIAEIGSAQQMTWLGPLRVTAGVVLHGILPASRVSRSLVGVRTQTGRLANRLRLMSSWPDRQLRHDRRTERREASLPAEDNEDGAIG
jgi:hypothetical protein